MFLLAQMRRKRFIANDDNNAANASVRAMTADGAGFVGKMQQLVVNGNQVFEMLRSGEFKGRSQVRGGGTATLIGPSRLAPPSALTFRSPDAYLIVNMKIHSTFSIYVQVGIYLKINFEYDVYVVDWYEDGYRYITVLLKLPRQLFVQFSFSTNDDLLMLIVNFDLIYARRKVCYLMKL